jgi:hypothetical protein
MQPAWKKLKIGVMGKSIAKLLVGGSTKGCEKYINTSKASGYYAYQLV